MNYMATAGNKSFQFLTYQLPTVRYWLTVAMTGDGGLGFDSGEGAFAKAGVYAMPLPPRTAKGAARGVLTLRLEFLCLDEVGCR
eukprot:UN2770